ncbi:MAG: cation diffusion facilitator family transporter [Candidatus Limivicinus sp.]|nr:cation diffusion facilitator family transporter [Clostridiales bacterium]MDY6133509.1 cation diffusion facilitator family transporter [Candidatus Limivicinus sp.]
MIKLLTKLFIKDHENVTSAAVRRAYGTMCSLYGIFLNLLLFAGKYIAGLISGSVAITADAFNNLSDAGSSIITLLGFAIAGKKPDPDHPFGHGRAEYLAGLVLSGVIILMGFELVKSSFEKILHPEPISSGLLPAVILVCSILVKFYMCLYNRSVGKKINSAAMQATATDSLSDSIATTVVLLSMGISYFFHVNIDGYAGLLVAVFIIYAGFNAAKDTVSPLLGQAPAPEFVQQVADIVTAHPEVVGIHDLAVHDYGPGRVMVSLHAEVSGDGNIFALHDAIDTAETELKEQLGCIATIHMDPIEADNTEVSQMRAAVAEKLKELDDVISIHDFRMVPGPTHTNLIFDAVVPADYKKSDEELAASIRQHIHQTWPDRYAVVNIDHSYI